jgi:YidC/Oxa1 family membrane protein insertase
LGSLYNSIINPIAWVLGKILDFLFMGLHAVGLGNIAIAIIVFTLLVKLLMLPLSFKQSKMTKLNSVIAPEVKAIQDKYKDKKNDQDAMLKMQAETKAVYEKYGTSQMGGCVQLLIQFPILMALYRVMLYIPMYVSQLKNLFLNILTGENGGIMGTDGFADIMTQNFSVSVRGSNVDWTNIDSAVTGMNSFTADQWEQLKNLFPAFADIISQNQIKITEMNTFLGINVSQNPTFALNVALLIPILAGITQYISVKVGQGNQQLDDDNPAAASMKMMTLFMPIMSAFIAFSVPAGLGLYWIATAVFQTIIQLGINYYYDRQGIDKIVEKNIEKNNKKRAKKGLPPEKIAKNATASTKQLDKLEKNQQRIKSLEEKKAENEKKVKEILSSTEYYKSAKPGSLAEKAGMVAKYNEKSNKK